MDLFDFNKHYIFHIPHASCNVPNNVHFNDDLLTNEIIKLTDWATDLIFDVDGIDKIRTNFSRVFCDVERYSNDDLEIMSNVGRGVYYTSTDDGQHLRVEDIDYKQSIITNYYDKHHNLFNSLVNEKLKEHKIVTIVDCHSFSDVPFNSDLIKEKNRPDICIGTDDFHTPVYLEKQIYSYFKKLGYTVSFNNPYNGTIVPELMYGVNKNVESIMIEINRKLYMPTETTIDVVSIIKLQKEIQQLFNNLI